MNKLQSSLYIYFIPPKYMVDEKVFRKSRIFVNTIIITFIFSIFYVGNCLIFNMPHVMWQIGGFSILYLSLLHLFKNGGSLIVCGNLFSLLFYTSTVYDVFHTGGLQSPIIPWFALVPVLSMLMTKFKYALVFLILCVLCIILVGIAQENGVVFPLEVDHSAISKLVMSSHAGLVLIVFVVASVMESAYTGSMLKLEGKNKIIEQERKRSDELLLNILPAQVMNELKETGKTIARNYDLVSVFFADFSDFTTIIEEMPPEELVSAIDEYFKIFDGITEKHGVEKIKTVGDAYICASGLPLSTVNNPVIIIDFALEILDAIKNLQQLRFKEGKVFFDVRIGVHSGPLVAGVVGIKKFAYDIWGDTVNTAARMQQYGEPGKINISGTTYNLIKHRFACTKRGRIEVKHMGLLDMYFVENRK